MCLVATILVLLWETKCLVSEPRCASVQTTLLIQCGSRVGLRERKKSGCVRMKLWFEKTFVGVVSRSEIKTTICL